MYECISLYGHIKLYVVGWRDVKVGNNKCNMQVIPVELMVVFCSNDHHIPLFLHQQQQTTSRIGKSIAK